MNHKLFFLAKVKGFTSVAFTDEVFDELTWLFWLTELHRWLRESHEMLVVVSDNGGFLGVKTFNYGVSKLHNHVLLRRGG